MKCYLALAVAACAGTLAGVLVTFGLITNPVLSIVPILLVILFGCSMTALAFCWLRLRTAHTLDVNPVAAELTPAILRKVLKYRALLHEIYTSPIKTREADADEPLGNGMTVGQVLKAKQWRNRAKAKANAGP